MRSFTYFFIVFPWLKLRMNWPKYMVMALPIILLTIFLSSINTLHTSISYFIDNKILPIVEKQDLIIAINDSLGEQEDFFFNPADNSITENNLKYTNFKAEEVEEIRKVEHVTSAEASLDPVMLLGETESLIADKHIIFNQFKGLSSATAQHLELEDFSYTPGGVLPIYVGVKSLKEYKDTAKNIDSLGESERQRLLEQYQEEQTLLANVDQGQDIFALVGKEIDLQIGSLQWQPVLYRVAGDFENTFEFIPSDVRMDMQQRYYDKINRYWDAEQLKQGTTVKAKVVGIDSILSPGAVSIPNEAVTTLQQELAAHLEQAQHTKAPPVELGTTYRGIAVENNQPRAEGGYLYFVDIPNQSQELPGIFIPGLFYTPSEQGSPQLLGAADLIDFDYPLDRAFVTVDAIDNTSTVYNNLHGLGYRHGKPTMHNYSNAKGFANAISSATFMISIVFMAVALIVTFFLMLRIAKTSDYETGVVRVLGATKAQVLLLYAGFFAQQLLSAVLVGAVIGYGIVLAIAPFVTSAINEQDPMNFGQISLLYGEKLSVAVTDFYHIDLLKLGSDIGLILAISLAGLLAAALFAARVQPYTLVNNNRE